MLGYSPDAVATLVLREYAQLNFRPPDGQFTILAGFVLRNTETLKVISLGTGSKCLPASRLPSNGDALHDSHAEVLARRGAVRWLLEEAMRMCSSSAPQSSTSPWLCRGYDGKFSIKAGVELDMYISTVPCGDASTRYLASSQDADMAALKDSCQLEALPPNVTSRGRDNYSLYGVMRTKPGRADSPPTLSMSCSDKIASWNVLGIQGALSSRILQPVYLSRLVIGEVDPKLQGIVTDDCERALFGRLRSITGLPPSFRLNEPRIGYTSVDFMHSRYTLGPNAASGCNDSDSTVPREILINGIRRGVPPKHRHNPKFRPVLSKLSIYKLFIEVGQRTGVLQNGEPVSSYHEYKKENDGYQNARRALKGPGGPFEGWIVSGREWEDFDTNGVTMPR